MISVYPSFVGSRLASRWRSRILALAVAAAATLTPNYASAAEIVHVVAKGQTLGRIAKRYHVTVATLREVNDLKPGQRIHPGLPLVIPEKGKEREATKKAAAMRARASDGASKRADKADKSDKADKADKNGRADAKGKGKGKGDRADQASAKEASPKSFVRKAKRPGFVRIVRGTERLETQLLTRHGRLVPSALSGVTRMLRFFPTNSRTPVDPRLATLLGMVSDHFGGRTIQVVSGFRPYTPTQHTKHSNHNVGRAVDFSIEGVPNAVVRDYCRTFRNAGVGYYPNSTFVHLDVRAGKVYWVDYSRPGEAPRYDSQKAQQAADEAAQDVEPGSKETPVDAPQPPETTNGNPDAANPPASNAVPPGRPEPTPAATP
jgi:uncharacterized protein YcbK (DUF882 family)